MSVIFRGSAPELDVSEYEALVEKSEVLQDIHMAERQLEEGKGLSHEKAKSRVLEGKRAL